MNEILDYGDPTSQPFWLAAKSHRLVIQRCQICGHYQFYARPFCLACEATDLTWVEAAGTGSIYSQTVVHLDISHDFKPPYVVAVVELDEGPRLLSNTVGDTAIGDRVKVSWRTREDAPPLPVFMPVTRGDL